MTTQRILEILQVFMWIAFVGLCILAGTQLVTFMIGLLQTNLIGRMDVPKAEFSALWHQNSINIAVVLMTGLKAYLFYWVIKAMSKINLDKPFSDAVGKYIFKMSTVALQIGILGIIVKAYVKVFVKSDVNLSGMGGGEQYLLFAGILFVIAQIYRRGIELQKDNEYLV